VVSLTYSTAGDVTLNCALGGGGAGPPPPDFSCQGTSSTVAADPLVISGTVQDPLGLGGIQSVSGVQIEAHLKSDDSLVTSTVSDASGNFSLSIPTGGVPFDGYLVLTKSGFVPASAYWGRPLTASTSSMPFVLNSTTPLYLLAGGLAPLSDTGTIGLTVTDCQGTTITNIVVGVTATPVGSGPFFAANIGVPAGPNIWILNEPAGFVSLGVAAGGRILADPGVVVLAGQTTHVFVSP